MTKALLTGLTCIICKNLLWDLVELDVCHHVCCKYCINKWLKSHSNCPACRQKPNSYQPPICLIRSFGELKIKCSNNGCPCTPCYSNFVQHLEKCEYRKYKCTNEKCNYIGLKENVKSHCLNCKFRLEECKYCQQLVPFCEHEKHAKTVCQQEYTCQKCFVPMKRGYYFSKHHSENNENIQCLKAQVNLFQNALNEVNSEYEEDTIQREKKETAKEDSLNEQIKILEKKLDKIKNERSNLYSENKSLKNKLKTIEDRLENLFKFIKKEDKLNIIINEQYIEGIALNDNLICLKSNKQLIKGEDSLIVINLKNNKVIKKIDGYSFTVSTYRLNLISLNENKKIIVCACTKYGSDQKNGILVINFDLNNDEITNISEFFEETETFNINCICCLNINNKNDKNEETKIEKKYLLVGGVDDEYNQGLIKLCQIDLTQNEANIEILQDLEFEENLEGSISSIYQLKNGKIIISSGSGNILFTEPNLDGYNEDI